jgi:hypothetical protein
MSCLISNIYAINNDEMRSIGGDFYPVEDKQGGVLYLNFLKNNSDDINISKIYIWVKKEPNQSVGYISYCISADGDFLFDYKIETYVGNRRYGPTSLRREMCSDPCPVRNDIEKIELVIQKNHNYETPFPSVSLINLSLNGLSFLNDSPLVSTLSANSDHRTIRQYMDEAGPIITVTEGKNLSYIISLSKNKKIRLLDGVYHGPIDQIKIDNISIEGVPEAIITGIANNAILTWHDSVNVSIANISFKNSLGGIFLEDCSEFIISNIRINDFGVQNALSLKNTNNNSIKGICIYSNDMGTTGILMDNSHDNNISNNNIQVKNALYYLQNNSCRNTIYDRNLGKIFDNIEVIDEYNGIFSINNISSSIIISHSNNTWAGGDIHPCY